MRKSACFVALLFQFINVIAQEPLLNKIPGVKNITTQSRGTRDTTGFEQRDDLKDSIRISYRFLDSTNRRFIDSSLDDFGRYFSVPADYQYLGNNGAAAFPLIFQPMIKPGWDAGFHAFDIYRFTLENTKFYRTTKPFSMLGYQLASGKEQMIKVMHTQNPRPNLNVGFDYRLITAPGFFITQNTNHNSYRIFGNYQGKHKRYNAHLVLSGNTLRASENGGIIHDSLLRDPNKKDRFSIPVNLGNNGQFNTNPFITSVNTGNTYREFSFFFRQAYDFGKKDSLVINDSTTEYLFYPKWRFQHSFTFQKNQYTFSDVSADSVIYKKWYDVTLKTAFDTFSLQDRWSIIRNDLSLIRFPDTKNAAQFILAGLTIENMQGTFANGTASLYNLKLHGEYRNLTRNKLWDMLLKAELYTAGFNNGDYAVNAQLSRHMKNAWGDISVFFQNVNRTPSFIFDNRSSFNLGNTGGFSKENIISFGATSSNKLLVLGFRNHLINNYSYFKDYFRSEQYSTLINLLQVFVSKKIKISKGWNWYAEAVLQQTDASAPIKVPLLFLRNRLAYEGRLYKNLNLSTGIEARYYTGYNANNYSPVLGQFIPQDTVAIRNLPDISAFVHFRIKSFTAYIRAENLNTVSTANGFGFINNNFAAPHYPTQGLMFRLGIQWWFVN